MSISFRFFLCFVFQVLDSVQSKARWSCSHGKTFCVFIFASLFVKFRPFYLNCFISTKSLVAKCDLCCMAIARDGGTRGMAMVIMVTEIITR